MTNDIYFTVIFDLGKVVVFTGADGQVLRIVFDVEDRFEERPSGSKAAREIAGYLGGRKTRLDLKIDLAGESPFRDRVYRRVMRIPYGRTAAYGEIAADVGCDGAARAVGQAMAANRYPLIIPCHRVVSGDGKIGGFSSGIELKRHLLNLEGLDY